MTQMMKRFPMPLAAFALALAAFSPARVAHVSAGVLSQLDAAEAPSAAGLQLMLGERSRSIGSSSAGEVATAGSIHALHARAAVGGDVIAVNPAQDTPENTTQSETALAVRGSTVCLGYNNSGPGGLSGLSRSTNNGTSWTDLGGIGQRGDPAIAVHRATGRFYYAEIATFGAPPNVTNRLIGVATSTNDCQTFGNPVDASAQTSGLAATILSDKPWIAVDNTGGANDGNVYVCWTRFFDTNNDGNTDASELRFSRSTDGATTFVTEQILQANGTAPFGCSTAVGPAGQLYVAWADRVGGTLGDIRIRRSDDGGVNFGANNQVSTGNRLPGTDLVVACDDTDGNGTPDQNRTVLTGNIRQLHQAWIAVDSTGGPFNGSVYAVWVSDPVASTVDNSDVFFSRSVNLGVGWSTPVQLGAGGGVTDQFEPFVAVGGAGTIAAAWYDRRNDAANNMLLDVFTAFSRDGGATFDPLVRVSDVSFGVPRILPNFDPTIVNCYMGEYIAVAGDATRFYYAWGDNRNTLTTVNFPGGRLDPDVFVDTIAVPVVSVAVPVQINVKPGSNPNSYNFKGQIPIAVLTTAAGEYGLPQAFDATSILPLTVRFGPAAVVNAGGGAQEVHRRGHIEDSFELDEVTRDGDLDMVLHFRANQTGLTSADTTACARGLFIDPGGVLRVFFGCDSVVFRP